MHDDVNRQRKFKNDIAREVDAIADHSHKTWVVSS
jgi:hypothetical protein